MGEHHDQLKEGFRKSVTRSVRLLGMLWLGWVLTGCGAKDSDRHLGGTNDGPFAARPESGTVRGSGEGEWFEEVTRDLGVDFVHDTPTNYYMPDQVGSGVALLDFDRDGRLDLYCVQNSKSEPRRSNQLFRQLADGTFADVSEVSGANLVGQGMGAYAGDLNNDGWSDLVVTEYGAVRLLANQGDGTFREIPAGESGLDNPRWSVPASFVDYDRDGWLDLVVGNYLDYDPTMECQDVQGRQDFCAPKAFPGTETRLWRNVTGVAGGAIRLAEVTQQAGLHHSPGAALGLVCLDFDGDGWPDIFCADDGRPNRLFMNQGDGTFREEAAQRGLAYNAMGMTAADMGTALGDVDGDGLWDLFVTHLAEEFHGFWLQKPRGAFQDAVAISGLQSQRWRGTGFGTVMGDFDLDGHEDLALVSGSVRRAVPGHEPVAAGVESWWGRYAHRAQLFVNEGRGRFRDVSEENKAFCGQALVGRSLAKGDLDRDGGMDLVVGTLGGPLKVYRNAAEKKGRWVGLRLVEGGRGDRDAIGAEMRLHAGGRSWWAAIQPATSYAASHGPGVIVGLGETASIDQVEVRWADGGEEEFTGLKLDQWQTLRRGEGHSREVKP